MANNENLALNVRSGASLCDKRPAQRARICSKKTDREEERSVQLMINELRTQYQKTKMQSGVFAYFWYDPNHHYFHQTSRLTQEHARSWPAYTGQPNWIAPPGAAGLSPQMASEILTCGRLLKHKNTDVFHGAPGNDSLWLQTINGAAPPARQPFQLPPADRLSMSNYMIVLIESPEAYFVDPPNHPMDIEPLCPRTGHVLGTYMPVVDCTVVATMPAASPLAECIPCDPSPGETLYPPEPLDAGDGESVQIPICMLWGVMPSMPMLPPPRWILTQNLGKMARSAAPGAPGAPAGPPPLWHRVDQAGAWTAHPFRQLVAAGESGDYADPAVSCCYDDDVTDCSQYDNNKQLCITRPNCTYNVATNRCLQGTYMNSCATANCLHTGRVDFSEHLIEEDTRNCCRPSNERCTGMSFSNCISAYHCTWDQGDGISNPRCRTRPCTKEDCGGEEVTASVSGIAPVCQCRCKSPAVGKNFCYVVDSPTPTPPANCVTATRDTMVGTRIWNKGEAKDREGNTVTVPVAKTCENVLNDGDDDTNREPTCADDCTKCYAKYPDGHYYACKNAPHVGRQKCERGSSCTGPPKPNCYQPTASPLTNTSRQVEVGSDTWPSTALKICKNVLDDGDEKRSPRCANNCEGCYARYPDGRYYACQNAEKPIEDGSRQRCKKAEQIECVPPRLPKCFQPARQVEVGSDTSNWSSDIAKICENVLDDGDEKRSARCANNCEGCYAQYGDRYYACQNSAESDDNRQKCQKGPECSVSGW